MLLTIYSIHKPIAKVATGSKSLSNTSPIAVFLYAFFLLCGEIFWQDRKISHFSGFRANSVARDLWYDKLNSFSSIHVFEAFTNCKTLQILVSP